MSELTPCCFCVLHRIKVRHGASNVTTRLVQTGDLRGWTQVYVGERRVVSFMALTDHCVC